MEIDLLWPWPAIVKQLYRHPQAGVKLEPVQAWRT
jgi:hypothetical protein